MIFFYLNFFKIFLDFNGIGATNRTCREIKCLPYAGFYITEAKSLGSTVIKTPAFKWKHGFELKYWNNTLFSLFELSVLLWNPPGSLVYISVFKIMAKKMFHPLYSAQRFCYINLWPIVTWFMQYFWMSGFV